LKSNPQLQWREQRIQQQDELNAACERLERERNLKQAHEVRRLVREIREAGPGDPEGLKRVADANATLRRILSADELNKLLDHDSAFTEGREPVVPDQGGIGKKQHNSSSSKTLEHALQCWTKTREALKQYGHRVVRAGRKLASQTRFAALAAAFFTVMAASIWQLVRHGHSTSPAGIERVSIQVQTAPADCAIKVNGVNHGPDFSLPRGQSETVEVSRAGYQTQTVKIHNSGTQNVILTPRPVRVSISVRVKNGHIELDGREVAQINQGSVSGFDVPTDGRRHVIAVLAGVYPRMRLEFQANPGEKPMLVPSASLEDLNDLIVVAGMGNAARIYAGVQIERSAIGGQSAQFGSSGLDFLPISDQNNTLTYVYQGQPGALSLSDFDSPTLLVHWLAAGTEIAIDSNVSGATDASGTTADFNEGFAK